MEIDVVIERLKSYWKNWEGTHQMCEVRWKVWIVFFSDELRFARYCVKQGNAFHAMIKTNEPLPTNAYWVLFCGNHTIDMQVQHGKNNWKMKASMRR